MLISFRGRKINYSETGTGEVIVLIHGYLETMEVWESFSKKLSKNFRVLRMDIPGHGLSETCGEINSMDIIAGNIKELLDSLGINRAFLIGHSMGGYATLAFLQLFPEYLSGYSLFHSHPLADTAETIEKRKENINIVSEGKKNRMITGFIQKLYADKNLEKLKSSVEKSTDIAFGIKKETIIADLKGMMARPDMAYLVEEGRVPFLWILGTMDNHIDCNSVQHKVNIPGNSRVFILNNSGHMGFIEEEELSVKIVTDFVNSLPPAPADAKVSAGLKGV